MLKTLALLFAVKNTYQVVVERLLGDRRPPAAHGNLISESSTSTVELTVTARAWEHARTIATGYVRDPDPKGSVY